MSDRVCVRGCTYRGRHRVTCAEASPEARLLAAIFTDLASAPEKPCTGCEPREAYDGAMLCERCIVRLRQAIEDAPDLIGHLRTLIDPRKATAYDADKLNSGAHVHAPAPMNVDQVDAADTIIVNLSWWAGYFDESGALKSLTGLPSTITPEDAFDVANELATALLTVLPEACNDSMTRMFANAFLSFPEDREAWSFAKAKARFPMEERAKWHRVPCPACGLRTVWVTPPARFGLSTRYVCKNDACGWFPPVLEERLWAQRFEMGLTA